MLADMLTLNKNKSFEKRLLKTIEDGNPRQMLAFFREYPDVSDITLLKSLHEVVVRENITLAQIIFAAGVDLNRSNPQNCQQILVSAIRSCNANMVRFLIDEGIDKNVEHQEFHGQTPLQCAMDHCNEEIFDLLVSSRCSINCKDIDGMIALHTASNELYTRRLVDAGEDMNTQEIVTGHTPLHKAVTHGVTEVVQSLVELGADVGIQENENGYIPLHIAMLHGNKEAVDILLSVEKGNQVNAVTRTGQNCMHLLTRCPYPSVQSLIDAGCSTVYQDENEDTPLMSAIKSNNISMALDIVEYTPEAELLRSLEMPDKNGDTIFHILGSKSDMSNVLKNILFHINDISFLEKKNNKDETPLVIASRYGNLEQVDLLMQHGVNVNTRSDEYGSVVHVAITNDQGDIIQRFLEEENLKLDMMDQFGETILQTAIIHGNYRATCDIISKDKLTSEIINTKNKHGLTAVHHLVQKCPTDFDVITLQKLFEKGANINVQDFKGNTPLNVAVMSKNNNINYIMELVKLGADVNLENNKGRSALHEACFGERIDVAKYLLNQGINCATQDESGDSPLHIAAIHGQEEIIHEIITRSPQACNINCIGSSGKTVLYRVVEICLHASFDLLMENGAQSDVVGSLASPLIVAARNGQASMVKHLLERNANINACECSHGRSALIAAAGNGHDECVQLLLNNNADPSIQDKSGDTALTRAAWGGHANTLLLLINLYPDLNHTEHDEGMSALHLAIAREHTECVQILLDAGADVNLIDHHGNTALLSAAMLTSGVQTLELVLGCNQGYDINAVGDKGRTALHWAVGEPESVRLLLWYEPNLDLLDENQASPLLLAIAHKQPESAKFLIKAGCETDMVHSDGRCPIHHAAVYGDHETTQSLIEHGVHPDTPMEDGRRPLLIAAIENHTKVLETLLQYPLDIDHIYFDAFTALSTAISHHNFASIITLLDHGANPDIIGSNKHRPLIHAILTNYIDGIVALIQAGADINAGLDDGKHPLQVSGMKNNSQIVQLLLDVGCTPSSLRYIFDQGVISYFLENDAQLDQIRELSRQPWSLIHTCRQILRGFLRKPLVKSVTETQLPQPLREFIIYAELNNIMSH